MVCHSSFTFSINDRLGGLIQCSVYKAVPTLSVGWICKPEHTTFQPPEPELQKSYISETNEQFLFASVKLQGLLTSILSERSRPTSNIEEEAER